jgi:hypothetical protein
VLKSQKIIKACGGECEGKKTKYFKPLLSRKYFFKVYGGEPGIKG